MRVPSCQDLGLGCSCFDIWLYSLVKALKANPSPQVQYWAIFCFWELSYEDFVAETVDK